MSDFAAPIAGAFDPTLEPLDLTKDEKRRTTAIMMALAYYEKTIVKDSAMYQALVNNKAEIVPAHEDRVMEIAMKFDYFIESGQVLLKDMILRVQIPEDENGPETGPNGEALEEDHENGS